MSENNEISTEKCSEDTIEDEIALTSKTSHEDLNSGDGEHIDSADEAEPEVIRSEQIENDDTAAVTEIGDLEQSCSYNEIEDAQDDVISLAKDVPTTSDEGVTAAITSQLNTDQDGNEDFFEKFSSIRISYENSEKRNIQEFKFHPDDIDGQISDQLWPTLGGWNIDDLYSEVLYALVHPRRFRDNQPEADTLVAHLQQVFHIDNDKHAKLLENAKDKQAPPLVLNLEVVEAKGLKGKDVNGLSDPFCTIFVSPRNKHNTSMKPETLNPVWREYFSLPVSNAQEEVLHIEVWDYDPEETLKDKMKRFGEVKSTRGLRILMKEIALTASTGKQSHEFLGCLKIPLKEVPTEGSDRWCALESRNGNGHKKKGDIHLKMALGAEKEKKVAAQEYRHVLHLMLVHELDEENIEPHQWEGKFSSKSAFILRTLELQGGLTKKDIDIAQWIVFTRVQCEHPLNAKIFPPLFQTIIQHVKNQSLAEDELRKFWFATEKLVENFVTFFRSIHQCFVTSSNNVTSQIYYMLKTLEMLKTFLRDRPKSGFELESKVTVDFIMEKTENAISRGANEFFTGIAQYIPNSAETEVEHLIKVAQLLIADLRKGLDLHHNVFKEMIGVEYFDITYMVYDEKYCEIVKPIVAEIVQNLKPLDWKNDDGCLQDKDVSMGTTLFELYLAVKQFSDLSSTLKNNKDLCIHGTFHNWFHTTVAQWLDIAWFKAMNRIRKAVQLDTLKPLDDLVHFTSSAVDTAHIFHQIEIFWNQLSWPEVEGSYSFIAKILDDLCRCTIFYADLTCKKVDELEKCAEEKYEVSDELCFAINNIELVADEMKISEKLGMDAIIDQLSAKNGPSVADQCKRTLTTVMENAAENINNKIIEVLEKVGLKMRPVIQKLLLEGCETDSEEYGVEKLVKYLDKNLIKLKNKLRPATFDKVFAILWENASVALRYLITTNIEKRRPPSFFKQIHCMIQILIGFFYPEGPEEIDSAYNSNIQEMENLVGFYGASTTELIMKYYQNRHEVQAQKNNKTSDLGSLTVRAHYCEDIRTLRIELLNARNLKPHDSNGQCDPYVKAKLVPRDTFPSAPIFKTKVKKKTLFPLFDEIFSVPLSPDELSTGGIVMFTMKDHDFLGRNDFLGECFLPLESIPFTMSNTKLQDLPQIYLPLTLPKDPNSIILQTLENRHWDKSAAEFVKKERTKMIPSPNAQQ